ncbi:hypothetical protein TKK_0017286 [Trichogramma kaykai]
MRLEVECADLDFLNENIKGFDSLLLLVNIRRLNNNIGLLEAYVTGLTVKPKVIICTETWLLECPNLYNMCNYKTYYNHGNINMADGVVIYVRDDVIHSVKIVEYEAFKVLECDLVFGENNKRQLSITSLYRCHGISKADFVGFLHRIFDNKKRNHIVAGDFNINILHSDADSTEFLNECYASGYLPLLNTVTRPNKNGGTCIDNMLAKTNIDLQPSKYVQVLPDHYPLLCGFNCGKGIANHSKQIFRLDYNRLLRVADATDWSGCCANNDSDIAIEQLIIGIKNCIEQATVNVKKSRLNFRKPWMTQAIYKCMRHWEHLYKLWKVNTTSDETKKQYNAYANYLRKLICTAKANFEIKTARDSSGDSKKLWNYIRNRMGNGKSKTCDIQSIKVNDVMIKDPDEMAIKFNEYFSDIGKQLARKIREPDIPFSEMCSSI